MPTKIFIGNVNCETKPDQLQVLFEQYGKVNECNIIGNYAFVHMEYESEANQAIRQLDGYLVCNSQIRVELSHGKKGENAEKKDFERKYGKLPTKIFIGNVNPNTKPHQLQALFEQYGKVTECDIINDYAFVRMKYESEAYQAIRQLDGHSVCNSRIRVGLSHGKKGEDADKKAFEKKYGQKTTKIFVDNVNPNTQADQLRALFEQYGKVTECDIIKNYAFVHMEDENEANQAISQLDGYSVCNSQIRVELSHGKKNENAEKKPFEKKFGKTRGPPGNQGATRNFNSPFLPDGFGNANWSDVGNQTLPFHNNQPNYFERDGQRPLFHDRYPSGPGPMSDRMGPPPPERYSPQNQPPRDRMIPPHIDRMRPSNSCDRRPPPPPHAQRDPYYMDRDPYYRERSPLSRPPPDNYDRNPKRDYPLSPYQNNDMGGFKRDAPMGRDMGMRSMGMDAPLRDQMHPGQGGMDPMRRDNMGGRGRGPGPMGGRGPGPMSGGGGHDNYGQGDPMDHPMGNRQMNPMMRDRPGMGGMNNNGGYNNYNGQQSSGGGYNMNNSYSNYNNDRPRPGMDNNYRDGYQGMGGGGGQPPMGNQKKANLPDQSFLQTGPIFF